MNETNVPGVEKVNRSKLILAAFQSEGLDTPANDIVNYIKSEAGVDVTVSLVNNLRSKVRKAKEERKEKRKRAASKPAETTQAPVVVEDALTKLFKVKEFAATVGGLTELKSLVEKLEALAA